MKIEMYECDVCSHCSRIAGTDAWFKGYIQKSVKDDEPKGFTILPWSVTHINRGTRRMELEETPDVHLCSADCVSLWVQRFCALHFLAPPVKPEPRNLPENSV